MSSIQSIPLSQLVLSSANVRHTDNKSDLDMLAASIAAHGLLQNLAVAERADGKYEVVAGGRRFGALKLLVKQGERAKDWPVPCQVIAGETAFEASLAENVQRVAMNVMDEMEAFAALAGAGMSVEDIASRFGSTVRHVEQRIALGRLSPKLRAAYRKGEITLDVARAFCLSDDHDAQERLFKQFAKPITHAPSVRAALAQGRISATDKLALFIGLGAYEAAGGKLVRDLFEQDVAYLEDADLVQRLAQERSEAIAAELSSEGWGWVEVQLHHGQIEGCAPERVRPTQRALTATEQNALGALERMLSTLSEQLEANDEDDALWTQYEDVEERLDALREQFKAWDAKQMALAGAVIAIDPNGSPVITRGLIKRSDVKALRKLQHDEPHEARKADGEDIGEPITPSSGPRLPKTLVQDLTKARTRELRCALAQAPHVALALAVYTLLQRTAASHTLAGINIAARPIGYADTDAFERKRSALFEQCGSLDVAALANQPAAALMHMLAFLVAETLDFSNEGASSQDERLQDASDALASVLNLDMRDHWRADAEFWRRAPKAFILDALAASPPIADLAEKARKARLSSFEKLKKSDLAAKAAKALQKSGWLPDCLMTPPRTGALAITPEGEAAIADQAAA